MKLRNFWQWKCRQVELKARSWNSGFECVLLLGIFLVVMIISCGAGKRSALSPGFLAGPGVAQCDLFDSDKLFSMSRRIGPGEEFRIQYVPNAAFVRCFNRYGKFVMPQSVEAPICPFLGETPSCPVVAPGTKIEVGQ